jgi:hypothetical protein
LGVAAGVIAGEPLPDIVEETGGGGGFGVELEFFGEEAREAGDFDAMVQHVLAVTRAHTELTEGFDDERRQARDARAAGGLFPGFLEASAEGGLGIGV